MSVGDDVVVRLTREVRADDSLFCVTAEEAAEIELGDLLSLVEADEMGGCRST